jgi:Rieske 2Fe-2S family protein
MYLKDRLPLPAGVNTLPARYYVEPALFERELEAVHLRMWLCAGRAEQITAPGAYFVRRIGGANVVILRGENGAVAAFHNVCRHRGTILCKEPEGRLSGRISCPYHAWSFALDGRLLSAPHMEQVEGFRLEDYPLKPVAAGLWDGHVFIHLAAAPRPLEEHLAELPAKFRPWRMEELRRVERRVYSVKANWKLLLQNYSECLHCPIAHPLLQKLSHYLSGANEPPRPSYLGGRMDLRDGIQTLSMDGSSGRSCLRELPEDERRRVYFYALLPNLLLSLHPDYMLTCTLWPQAVDRTEVICEWHFHPDAMARPGFDPRSAIEFWDLTNRQDWELTELAHEGIASRGYEPGPYSNREELLHAIDRFALERLEPGRGAARSGADEKTGGLR